jgi:DNA-binding NtrC family response regulator
MPPLRERRDDIPLLARFFAQRQADKTGRPIHGFSSAALDAMSAYNWPGNVRELKNAVDYAFVVCREELIGLDDLPDAIRGGPHPAPALPEAEDERRELIDALRLADGNQTRAAEMLGVSRMTVWKRMKKHDVNIKRDIG